MSPFALLDPAVRLAYSFVTSVAELLPLPSGAAAVCAVALLTVLVRTALLPLAVRAARADRARRAVAPAVDKLRKKYRDDPARLTKEVSQVYRDAGTSPLAGMGAALVQLPVVSTVYRVVVVPTIAGHPNVLLAANLWGVPLSVHWPQVLAAAGLVSGPGLLLVLLLGTLTGLAWVWSRQLSAQTPEPADAPPGLAAAARIGRLAPFATVAFAAFSPLLVGTYLAVTTAWSVGERALMPRFAGPAVG